MRTGAIAYCTGSKATVLETPLVVTTTGLLPGPRPAGTSNSNKEGIIGCWPRNGP